MVDGNRLGRKARGEGAGDLRGADGTGEPDVDGGNEVADVPNGERQPGIDAPKPSKQIGGGAAGEGSGGGADGWG